jgi:regulator of sigma E protease
MTVIIFIVVLLIIVLVHEYGHFSVAKRNGIRVDEFGIGFPPKALSLGTHKGTEFTLNWLPLGGFVRIFGENREDVVETPQAQKESMAYASRFVQAKILFAGPLFNILFAWLLFSVTFMLGTFVSTADPLFQKYGGEQNVRILETLASGPAEVAGIAIGDHIQELIVADKTYTVTKPEDVSQVLKRAGGAPVTFVVAKKQTSHQIVVTPQKGVIADNPDAYAVGISYDAVAKTRIPFFASFVEGAKHTWVVTRDLVVFVAKLVTGGFSKEVYQNALTGPVGVARVVGSAASVGFSYLLTVTAFISINLGVINLVPFPALDGGRLAIIGVEALTKKRISPKVLGYINTIGFVVLIALMLFITYKDVAKLL